MMIAGQRGAQGSKGVDNKATDITKMWQDNMHNK